MIIGIDVGAHSGLCVYDSSFIKTVSKKCKKLDCFFDFVEEYIKKYNPKTIVTAKPTRLYSVIYSQAKKIGIIEYLCNKYSIKLLVIVDSSAKKSVIGSGKAKKPDIISWANSIIGREVTEHEADSMMFVQYLINNYLETVD